jgi:hypothetical protein
MKIKFKKIWILFVVVFYIVLFSNIIFSNSTNPFTTPQNCSNIWGNNYVGGCNNYTINDAFYPCNGTQSTALDSAHIKEVYINASSFFIDDGINVTCTARQYGALGNNSIEIWYNDTNNWYLIQHNDSGTTSTGVNYSTTFKVNSTEGTHIVRCMIRYCSEGGECSITGSCVNSSDGGAWDNDDVNFTVTSHLTYSFWNLTNYTNGSIIVSGANLTRNDSINISSNWSKNINYYSIEINGTGNYLNYTYPGSGNWINFTLNLSNTTMFNQTNITIRSIYVNDSYSATNNTLPLLYFYLSSGAPPNITSNHGFFVTDPTQLTSEVNLFESGAGISVNVYDDVGISLVIANITYPNGNSTNATMTRRSYLANNTENWVFYFNTTLPLNETGYYVARIIAIDIGGQEKASGADVGSNETASLHVINSYVLTKTSGNSPYMRGENVTIQANSIVEQPVENVNWTGYLVRGGLSPNSISSNNTTYTYQIANDDPEGTWTLFATASKNNNSGTNTWQFNVSKNLSLIISTSTALNPGNTLNISVNLYNARGELYTNLVNANITCLDGMHALNFNSGYASILCNAPSSGSASFTISANVSDQYNNTGENSTTFTTIATPSSSGGYGGSSPITTEAKKCSDGTNYTQCSSKKPYYCLNGNLTMNCSICGCNPGYSCQTGGLCILTKEEDFNFTIDSDKLEIEQGKDAEIKGHLTNTGNTVLNLMAFLNISEDCCNISIPQNFTLSEKEEREFTISVHVPLFTNASSYWMKIGIGTEYVKKDKLVDILVTESAYRNSLSIIENDLKNLEKEIQGYKNVGINTGNLEKVIEQSKTILSNANSSISSDQINVLSSSVSELKSNINSINSSLSTLIMQKFLAQYSWLIILLIISSVSTVYLVPEVFIPLYKLEKEVKKLKEEEKNLVSSRVETEKQYFMRKIDENTFSKMMITKQDNILKTRVTLTEKEKGRSIILKRTHPKEIIKWFGRGVKNLPRNIKNILVKTYEKLKTRIKVFKIKPKMTRLKINLY